MIIELARTRPPQVICAAALRTTYTDGCGLRVGRCSLSQLAIAVTRVASIGNATLNPQLNCHEDLPQLQCKTN